MKSFKIEITGTMPLLMHADNIQWADQMAAWRKDPKNKKASVAGDDRTPPFTWIGCLNTDGKIVTVPSEYIMRCVMEGAAQVSTGKGQKTFKSLSQSGIICRDFHWPLLINGSAISMDDIKSIKDMTSFEEHEEAVKMLGFTLFVKRARIGTAKHIRVRPRFDNWKLVGEISVIDDQITKTVLMQILEQSGRYKGLGDWRPGSKTPGQWGTFEAEIV